MGTLMRDEMKITLGPLLLMLALVMFLSKYSLPMAVLGAMAAGSVPLVWRFQLKAAIGTVALLLLSFLTVYTFYESSYLVLWIFFWCLTLAAGLVVTALCAREYYAEKRHAQLQEQEQRLQLEKRYQKTEQQMQTEIEGYVQQADTLERTLKQKEHEVDSFKRLVMASKEEADKYFMQCEHLSQEVSKLYEQVSAKEALAFENRQLEERSQDLLKQLNELRVLSYQYEMLAFASKVEMPAAKEQLEKIRNEQHRQELLHLEEERNVAKKCYEEHLREYQALADKLQTFFTLDEIAYYTQRESSLENAYAEFKIAFEAKGKMLQEVRMDIFKIEGAIVQLKKHFDIPIEESISPDSYLAVADQECLRLEEENAILLQLMSQTLPLLEQRLDRYKTTEPLESHNHFE